MSKNITDITDATFENEVLKADGLVLIDFWAPWCGPCLGLAPVLEELATDKAGRLKVVKVNVDENPALTAAFGIKSIPTLVLFRDGQPLEGGAGAPPKKALYDWVDGHLNAPAAAPKADANKPKP